MVRTVEIRQDFSQVVDYCLKEGIRFVIVSNGIGLYVDAILLKLGLADLERCSGQAHITSEDIAIDYIDQMGVSVERELQDCLPEPLQTGEQPIVCIGDGIADIPPTLGADHVIARSELLDHFQRHRLPHFAFETFYYAMQHHPKPASFLSYVLT